MNYPAVLLARNPLSRHLALFVRAIWRPVFTWRCRWLSYRTLQDRARLVMESPDWLLLPRVPDAGRISGLTQIMHNGQRIRLGSYYGYGCVPFFHRTKGVHEPREEIAFAAVLPLMPSEAVMVELGSYWAFYSMRFAQQVPQALLSRGT